MPLPRAADRRLVPAVDATYWQRPDHRSGPCVTPTAAARTSTSRCPAGRIRWWTALLEPQRLAPGDDAATVTAGQLRNIVRRLIATGQWRPGDLEFLVVANAGHDASRLALPLREGCPCRSSRGCAQTGYCAGRCHFGSPRRSAGHPPRARSDPR
ncbi:hypothetical protein [Micromonospora sp. NPDC093243]|uniref:hypothetical protein n=1 Tax=Micromonospora sp. NPDC093243 TaxID=3364290 RepID=UPI00381F2A2E